MSDDPQTPGPSEDETTPESTATPPATVSRQPSPIILGICFIIIVLLGVIITQNMLPGNSAPGSANSPLIDSMKADIETSRAALNRERISMGLAPLSGMSGAESADEVAARLEADAKTLASIAKSFENLLIEREAQLDKAREETIAALKVQQDLRRMLDAANTELRDAMIDASRSTTLTAELERALARIASMQQEIDRLRVEPDDLRRQLAECTTARTSLQQRLQELERLASQASLFANSESELLKEAVALFQALRKLQNKSESELASAYSQFGAQLGATVLRTCSFATGSAEVTPELENLLIPLPNEIPQGAMMFVVGYASETGNVDSNRELSSDRATNVARVLDAAKLAGQKVQAVYLGQTKRFDKNVPERNQIVEVWQIIPKSVPGAGGPPPPGLR